MNALCFDIRLIQPVLVTKLGAGEENSSEADDYLPGSSIRGAIIDRYLAQNLGLEIAHDPHSRSLFFDGTVRFLNAYPRNQNGGRMFPNPLSWRQEKDKDSDDRAPIYDFAIKVDTKLQNPQAVKNNFVQLQDNKTLLYKPSRYIQMHNASDVRFIKKSETSFVYRYEALAAGEVFSAAVISDRKELLDEINRFLTGETIKLGGARSSKYGEVAIENIRIEAGDWQETGSPVEFDSGKSVIITLLSDAIFRDQNGQPLASLDPVLSQESETSFSRTKIVGGFNRKWGLPTNQSLALQAGSVFVYSAGSVSVEKLKALQQKGIGERLVEGFGRIAIGWQKSAILEKKRVENISGKTQTIPPVELSSESHNLAERMASRQLKMILDRKLVEAVASLEINPSPENAQLSRLRAATLRAQREKDLQGIKNQLQSLKSAREQFERARIVGKFPNEKGSKGADIRFSLWLEEGVSAKNRIWKDCLELSEEDIPEVAGVRALVSKETQAEYVALLLDALCRKTARAKKYGR
jgi:CRISPR-associated protein Csx10